MKNLFGDFRAFISRGNVIDLAVAVVIGNKSYVGAIPEVRFAHNDADAVKRYLINTLGYREGNVIDVRDTTKGELEAIFGNEKSYKGRLFNYIRANESDVTVFYSGHGVPDTKSRRGYLLPIDADPDIIDITGYPLDVMLENLSKIWLVTRSTTRRGVAGTHT